MKQGLINDNNPDDACWSARSYTILVIDDHLDIDVISIEMYRYTYTYNASTYLQMFAGFIHTLLIRFSHTKYPIPHRFPIIGLYMMMFSKNHAV